MSYLKYFPNRKATPQSQPIPGSNQVPNSAGGYAFAVDDWKRLDRFLVLGSEGGSYYASERKLTAENADAVLRCLQADGIRTVKRIVEISDFGRAPKNEPAILALAIAFALGDADTRRAASEALPQVCRIGTHLFHFAHYVNSLRGWGRGLRRAVANWYVKASADDVAFQAVKYQQRDGWSHRDLLRLSHPTAPTNDHQIVFNWIVKGWPGVGDEPHPVKAAQIIWAYERARTANKKEILRLIRDYRLPREALPTQWLNEPEVWEALLPHMGLTALLRNLGTMSKIGLLADQERGIVNFVVKTITSQDNLRKARIHPVAVLSALLTYQQGRGVRGSGEWSPVTKVIDALDTAFYAAFGNVEPCGKRLVLALDVSGSMEGGAIAGVPGLTPRIGSAAMALITAATESDYAIMGFSHELVKVNISPRQRLDDVADTLRRIPMGGTDCALPMLWAKEHKVQADAFVVYTDSETWFGKVHPVQALRDYRETMGIPARLIVVGMVANQFSIADPNDAGMLDVVGFDTAAPQLISDFVKEA
ncbi:MAG: TROVE domain-containing protein [Anaerolineae bacterium]|nr:TROVE domain-containing protein [Anaerolineae bacterium]